MVVEVRETWVRNVFVMAADAREAKDKVNKMEGVELEGPNDFVLSNTLEDSTWEVRAATEEELERAKERADEREEEDDGA